MMKLPASLLLLSSLVLFGCKDEEPWISLEFSYPATDLQGQLVAPSSPHAYEAQLANQFEVLGIPLRSLKFRRDREHSSVLHLHLREPGLDSLQREVLEAYLMGLVEARQRATFRMQLSTDDKAVLEVSGRLNVLLPRTSVKFDTVDTFESQVLLRDGLARYRPAELGGDARAEAGESLICAVTVRLAKPVSLSFSRLEPIEGRRFSSRPMPNMQGEVRAVLPNSAEPVASIPATLNIEDADLRRLLDEERLQPLFPLQTSEFSWGGLLFVPLHSLREVVFSLGPVELPSEEHPMLRYNQVRAACARRIATLGRPFTFQNGTGLDSLRYVTFWDRP